MNIIAETLSTVRLGTPAGYRNLAVFPLFSEPDRVPGYVTLDEALGRKTARVTEVSESGQVPELLFENSDAEKVLLVDGEELVGAKQNRILNVTILVGAGQKVAVPVSCVEQGRWHWKSRHFESSKQSLFARARAKKMAQVNRSLRSGASYRADQGEIWNDVEEKLVAFCSRAPTLAMSDAFEERGAEIDEYVQALRPAGHQVGAVFAVDGKVLGLELFDSAATFAKLMEKFLRSYAIDAIENGARDAKAPVEEVVQKFLEDMKAAVIERFPAVGEGEQLRLENDTLAGGALLADDRLVHVCVLCTPKAEGLPGGESDEGTSDIPPFLRQRRRRTE
ncbi:MAG TPA: DUF6569 family protein [Candidatus Binatia bacterium]|nr:DUF6569 family protein [Candidatus Binatia bacterium]